MRYKVVPFHAAISSSGTANDVASQLDSLIAREASSDWEYVRLESVETHVAGDSGCFGLGGKPGYTTSYHMAVFQQA
jgi:hypothetical protein